MELLKNICLYLGRQEELFLSLETLESQTKIRLFNSDRTGLIRNTDLWPVRINQYET